MRYGVSFVSSKSTLFPHLIDFLHLSLVGLVVLYWIALYWDPTVLVRILNPRATQSLPLWIWLNTFMNPSSNANAQHDADRSFKVEMVSFWRCVRSVQYIYLALFGFAQFKIILTHFAFFWVGAVPMSGKDKLWIINAYHDTDIYSYDSFYVINSSPLVPHTCTTDLDQHWFE